MRATGLFLLGLTVGVALGVGTPRILHEEAVPVAPAEREAEVSHAACRDREEALAAEIAGLKARAIEAAPAPTDAAAAEPAPAEDPWRAAVNEARAELKSIAGEGAGSGKIAPLIRKWRALLSGEDEKMARLGTWALKNLAAEGKLTPAEVEGFVAEYRALPAGSRARPGLAAVVTRAFAEDDRLAGWLGDIPTAEEPKVREGVIWALDESPSAAFRDYVLKLSREEVSADVLRSVWNEDIVLVTLTRDSAPKLVEAIRGRVGRGDLPPVVRARAYFAIGLAATHAPELAKSSLEALLASETDAGVAAFGKDVGGAVEREEANVQALEGLWDRHAESFGE